MERKPKLESAVDGIMKCDVNSDTLKKETPCYSHAIAFGTGLEVLISALEKWEL